MSLLNFAGLLIFSCSVLLEARPVQEKAAHLRGLKAKADEALRFCREKQFNTSFCILTDLDIHSGRKRFFVWDFKKDTVILSTLVSHGCGREPWGGTTTKEKALLSNQKGSHLSSAGKYRIGARGYSNWGININYRLHGLEKSNSNALVRIIVLHSWEAVPENEVYPRGTPEGWGCPAIPNSAMRRVDQLLKASQRPVLLWIYQ